MLPILGPGALIVQRTDIANCTPVNIGKVNSFTLARSSPRKTCTGRASFRSSPAAPPGRSPAS